MPPIKNISQTQNQIVAHFNQCSLAIEFHRTVMLNVLVKGNISYHVRHLTLLSFSPPALLALPFFANIPYLVPFDAIKIFT